MNVNGNEGLAGSRDSSFSSEQERATTCESSNDNGRSVHETSGDNRMLDSTAPLPSASVEEHQNDNSTAVKAAMSGLAPEYVDDGKPPLLHKNVALQNYVNTGSMFVVDGSALSVGQMKCIEDESLLDSAVQCTGILDSVDKKVAAALPDQVEDDIEGQATTNTSRRKSIGNIYTHSNAAQSSNHKEQNQRTDSFFRSSMSMPKVGTVVALFIIGFVSILAGAVLGAMMPSQSQESSGRSSTVTTTTSTDAVPVLPPSDLAPVANQLDSYKLHVCNPTDDGESETERCTAADCFSGPHCSCQMYIREQGSNSIIGLCNSCRVCDLNSNLAFDCDNLGSSIQECPLLTFGGGNEDEDEATSDRFSGADFEDSGIYSPPGNYIERFCTPTIDLSTELCFAGECRDNGDCRCDMYTQEASTGNVIGVCDACGICGDGSFEADCANVGLSSMACSNYENETSPLHEVEKAEDASSTISLITTDTPSSGSDTDIDTNNITTPELTMGKPSSGSDAEISSVNEPSTSAVSDSEGDYSCANSNNGFELCHAKSCEEPGCTCDAYFRDITTKTAVGTCSLCVTCNKGGVQGVGLVCNVYGIDLNLPC